MYFRMFNWRRPNGRNVLLNSVWNNEKLTDCSTSYFSYKKLLRADYWIHFGTFHWKPSFGETKFVFMLVINLYNLWAYFLHQGNISATISLRGLYDNYSLSVKLDVAIVLFALAFSNCGWWGTTLLSLVVNRYTVFKVR